MGGASVGDVNDISEWILRGWATVEDVDRLEIEVDRTGVPLLLVVILRWKRQKERTTPLSYQPDARGCCLAKRELLSTYSDGLQL